MEKLKVTYKPVDDIIPYENNPRYNDSAVEAVAESIKQTGYNNPIIVDENLVILAGHTRLKALKILGVKEVPVLIRSGLTENQKSKFRLLDNKTGEIAHWDYERLRKELDAIDFDDFDFGFEITDFDWAGVKDLSEDTFQPPEREMLTCPKCGATDFSTHFKKSTEKARMISDEGDTS